MYTRRTDLFNYSNSIVSIDLVVRKQTARVHL